MNAPAKTLKIDFVSDVVCPWCAIGLSLARDRRSKRVGGEIGADAGTSTPSS